MKRKITLSIALVLSILLTVLIKSDSTVNAEPPQKYTWDSGIVQLGEGQSLRIIVASGTGAGPRIVQFRQLEYTQTTCQGEICKQAISEQTTSNPITFAPNEAVSLGSLTTDPIGPSNQRVIVSSNSRDVRVRGIVFDTSTQRFVSQIEWELLN